MVTYREIHGKAIKSLSTDPTAETDAGQIWYNTTSNTFKSIVNIAAWSSLAPINTARLGSGQGGTATAGFIVSGGPSPKVQTEEFNGTGWSTGEDVSVDSYHGGGAGTLTAGLYSGGEYPPGGNTDRTIEYDGTNWTTVTAYPQSLKMLASCGTQTSALYATGVLQPPAGAKQTETREYDGSAWNAGGAYPTGLQAGNMTGASSTSALFMGGSTISPSLSANTYNGTAWTAAPDANSAAQSSGSSGIETSAIFFGGDPGYLTATQSFDGSAWTTEPALATGVGALPTGPMTASSSNAFKVGGNGAAGGGAVVSSVEEFTSSVNTITAGAWASGGTMTTGRYELGTVGTQTAGLAFGGNRAVNPPTGIRTETEEYNGSSWSTGGALPAAKATQGLGIQTAAVTVGGTIAPNPTAGSTTEEYNGTSWASSGTLNTATVASAASTGLESAGLRAGGGSNPTTRLDAVEEYNGSSWTSVTSLPATRFQFQGTGPQTASFFTGGNITPTTETTDSLDYDGTNWTSGPTMIFGMRLHAVSGNSNTDNLSFGGEQAPGGRSLAQSFDGTAFITSPSLATGRESLGGCGTASASLAAGGNNAPSYDLANTEEFTGETSAVNVKTLTQS